MTQQKAFYEIEKPARVVYMVAIKPDKNDCMLYPGCKNDDEDDEVYEVYQCEVCGGWFCWIHMGVKTTCDACMELPMEIRKEVAAFREKLNALR